MAIYTELISLDRSYLNLLDKVSLPIDFDWLGIGFRGAVC